MQRLLISIFCLLLTASILYAQKKYERPKFRYASMKQKPEKQCAEAADEAMKQAIDLAETNNSASALRLIEESRQAHGKCVFSELLYAQVLFRNGQRLKSNEIIDAAIKAFGPLDGLVRVRAMLCIEMAEYGVGTQAVDGNMVYLPESKHLPYKEEQFRHTNLVVASEALEYLLGEIPEDEKNETRYLLGQLYKEMGDLDKANAAFMALKEIPEYQNRATSQLIQNWMTQKKYDIAEKELLALCERVPRNFKIYQNLEGLYTQMGQTEKAKDCKRQSHFYYSLPEYTDLPYSAENAATMSYFEENHSLQDKQKALAAVAKRPVDEAIDIYIGILNMHANHDNGLETEATHLLGAAGEPAVEKLVAFLKRASSTCGMSNAGFALAEIKDERGWEAIVEMLPAIDRIGFTMMLPAFPQCLVNFDKERALTVMLPWIKERMERNVAADDENPMGSLNEMFADGIIYRPLNVFEKTYLSDKAKAAGYNEAQIAKLLEEVYYELPADDAEDKGDDD